jgi:uncharacterized protein YdiU (UPF0061 family)
MLLLRCCSVVATVESLSRQSHSYAQRPHQVGVRVSSLIQPFSVPHFSLPARPLSTSATASISSRSMSTSRMSTASAAGAAASPPAWTLTFDNRNLRDLPVDPITRIAARQVPNSIFSYVQPDPVKNPKLVSLSPSALSLLGLPAEKSAYYVPLPQAEAEDGDKSSTLASYLELHLSGNAIFPGSTPAAHCYCGHQFGSFSGQLGDGAAMYLGEVVVPHNNTRWELQLKGSGPTPYSRGSDGRKVLRSSIREYLCSEAMYSLGIATTRAGTVITSDSRVIRDPHYDGHPIEERCTIVSRIAQTFFRFGSFEIFKSGDDNYEGATGRSGPSEGNNALKKHLLDYVVNHYYSDVVARAAVSSDEDKYASVFEELISRTALLVAQWQAFGFVHGVLNTDNMSIVGLTIGEKLFTVYPVRNCVIIPCYLADYGPFGFMEHFDPEFVPNGSDGTGRYRYSAQPEVTHLRTSNGLSPVERMN